MATVEIQAEKDLSKNIEHFEHATSALQTLRLVSKEEQHTCIIAWSKLALACAEELQHGAMIWSESLRANVCTQILSRGNRYFVALGEIYRAMEILRASLKLYKPWLLSDLRDSRKVQTCLERCDEAWVTSGLKSALETMSHTMDLENESIAKALLDSIRHIHDLDEPSLRNHAFDCEKIVCKLSLLPIHVLKGVKSVVWNGEHYCFQLANLWANLVSRDPPQLPRIYAS